MERESESKKQGYTRLEGSMGIRVLVAMEGESEFERQRGERDTVFQYKECNTLLCSL